MERRVSKLTAWQFSKDKLNWEEITVPHTWNAVDGQDGGNDYYRGTCYYRRTLDCQVKKEERVFIEFNGAAMSATVCLNGEQLCVHDGGYSTFRLDLTEHLKGSDEILVAVDNSDNTKVYPQKADFTFYGGLYRDVNLITVPSEHFELLKDGTPGIKVTPIVNLEKKSAEVTVETWQNSDNVEICVADQKTCVKSTDGHACATFTIENVRLWDGVFDPYLYTATATLESGDRVCTSFGCRTYSCDPEKGFFLNGRSYPLRGVSRHQDLKGKGNALSPADHDRDMAIIREIGANTVRLAHYQHSQYFYDLCDRYGIVAWAEIPYITMHMNKGRENTVSQMRELVTQCYNHPSIVVWGLSNEITSASVVNEELLDNHRLLNDLCHEMDKTRLTVMANVFMLEQESPMLEIPDINSYNLYFGWYLGEMSQTDSFFDEYHEKYPQRVMGFSEYGADANVAYHSENPERGDYTEEFQCLYHEHMLRMIEERPYLWATHVWNLFDFAADGRDEGGKHGENQKGLVTFDRQTRKDAFYLYKAAWNKNESFVHLCGKRFEKRSGDETEIKVYSNENHVSLFVDNWPEMELDGSTVFTFRIPLTYENCGKHTIRAVSGSCTDEMVIYKVDEAEKSYIFNKTSTVVNWFDADFDPECFSVSDTLGELKANEKSAAVVNAMMAEGAKNRGDVAEIVKDNPALVRMMERITLLSLMKQSGASEENIKQMNRILQGIHK
ncbi:MAG: hypothetical protein K6F82_04330 [Sphaerochaetaceae bacterium]|nr:hypothetical protein [Sphaerochaetaceae bacterium]